MLLARRRIIYDGDKKVIPKTRRIEIIMAANAIKVLFRTGENRALKLKGKINETTGLLDVTFQKQKFSFQIVTKPIIMVERRSELLWFIKYPFDYYFVDMNYNKTISFEAYTKNDGTSGKIEDLPPQTLSDIVDYSLIKTLASRANQAMFLIFLIAGASAGFGLGFIANEIFVPCETSTNTVVIPSATTEGVSISGSAGLLSTQDDGGLSSVSLLSLGGGLG